MAPIIPPRSRSPSSPAMPSTQSPPAGAACVALARTWRLRRDVRDSYVRHARRAAVDLHLERHDFSLEAASDAETFLEVEKSLQRSLAAALLGEPSEELVDRAQARQSSFWSEALPEVQAEWALLAVAGQLLLEAERIEKGL